MKKLIIICVVTLFINLAIVNRADAEGIKVVFDGKTMKFSSQPILENHSILVPLDDIFKAFKMDVHLQLHNNSYFIGNQDKDIWVLMDSNVSWVDYEVLRLETPARMVGKKPFVPLQLISRAFDVTVHWDNGTKTVTITSLSEENEEKKPIKTENNKKIIKVSTGDPFSMALREDGTLSAWGSNASGVFGEGTTKHRLYIESVGNVRDWKDVATGSSFAIMLKKNGTIWSAGTNTFGELGNGTFKTRNLIPKQIGNDNQWSKVFAKYYRAGAIKKDGSLWVWGANEAGMLGDGTTVNRMKPVKIGKNEWADVSFGYSHTVGIKKDGTLWAWGGNVNGQLGIGNTKQKMYTRPTQIGKDRNWKSVSASGNYTIALKKDGTIWAWGINHDGQMGNGKQEWNKFYNQPVKIGKDSNWAKIAARGSDAYAIKKDGTLWGWGSHVNKSVPTQIEKDKKWTLIAEGSQRFFGTLSLAVTNNNKIFAWGGNNSGQAVIGPFYENEGPTEVLFPANVTSKGKCAPTRVMWGKMELKKGQIGKIKVIKNTSMYKKNQVTGTLEFSKTLKTGEEYSVYGKSTDESGATIYDVGGGAYVEGTNNITFVTPPKSIQALLDLKCEIK
jgi:alpha-tubulin suppressor-like RCC1 family protein